jgi:hypothetical protein
MGLKILQSSTVKERLRSAAMALGFVLQAVRCMCVRLWVVALLAIPTVVVAATTADSPTAFRSRPWLEDLEQMRSAMATQCANLEWIVFDREIDIAAPFEDAQRKINSATSDADARAIFDRIVRRLGDGHVRLRWSQTSNPPTTRVADCTALGDATDWQEAAVTPLIPGYVPLRSAAQTEFASGTIQQGHYKIGFIRIGTFSPKGLPELCNEALRALSIAIQPRHAAITARSGSTRGSRIV